MLSCRVPHFPDPSRPPSQRNIWLPTVTFSNTPSNAQSVADLRAALTVERAGQYRPAPHHALQEVAYYSGALNAIGAAVEEGLGEVPGRKTCLVFPT